MKFKIRTISLALAAVMTLSFFNISAGAVSSGKVAPQYTMSGEQLQNGIRYNKTAVPIGIPEERKYKVELSMGGADDAVQEKKTNVIIVMNLSHTFEADQTVYRAYLKSIYDMCDYIERGNAAENFPDAWRGQDISKGRKNVNFTFIAYNGNMGLESNSFGALPLFGSKKDAWVLFEQKTKLPPDLKIHSTQGWTALWNNNVSNAITQDTIYWNLLKLARTAPLADTQSSKLILEPGGQHVQKILNCGLGSIGDHTNEVAGFAAPKNFIGQNCFTEASNAEAAFQRLDEVLNKYQADDNQVLYISDRLPNVANAEAERTEQKFGSVDNNGDYSQESRDRRSSILEATGAAYRQVCENHPNTRFISLGLQQFNANQSALRQDFVNYINYIAGKDANGNALTYLEPTGTKPAAGLYVNWNTKDKASKAGKDSKAYLLPMESNTSPEQMDGKIWDYFHLIGRELVNGDLYYPYAENAILTDTIPAEFEVFGGMAGITACYETMENGIKTMHPIQNLLVSLTQDSGGGVKITWKIGSMEASKGMYRLSYTLKAKDSYFGGQIRATNKNAALTYNDHTGNVQAPVNFPVPRVYVPWKAALHGGAATVFYGTTVDILHTQPGDVFGGRFWTSGDNDSDLFQRGGEAYTYNLWDANALTGGSVNDFSFTWQYNGQELTRNAGMPGDLRTLPEEGKTYTLKITNGTLDDGRNFYPDSLKQYNQQGFELVADVQIFVQYGSIRLVKELEKGNYSGMEDTAFQNDFVQVQSFPVHITGLSDSNLDFYQVGTTMKAGGENAVVFAGLKRGRYTVQELVPGNYELVSITYRRLGSNEWKKFTEKDAVFTVGQESAANAADFPDYEVTITNKLAHVGYFEQSMERNNEISFHLEQGGAL